LAALPSFFSFVAVREPTAIAQCAEILRIPTKKAAIHAPCYLEPEEAKAILAQPDRSTIEGQRDHALLPFLYNTGARIQETLGVPGARRRWPGREIGMQPVIAHARQHLAQYSYHPACPRLRTATRSPMSAIAIALP
jgi:hypothetical protein